MQKSARIAELSTSHGGGGHFKFTLYMH